MARCGQRCRLVVFGEAGDGEVHFHEASELAPEPASSTSSDTVPARPSLSNDCTHSTAPLPSRRPTAASSTASQTRQNPTSTAAPNCCSHPSSSSSASRSLSRPHASTARYDCVLAPYARSRPHPSPVGHGAASKPSRLAPLRRSSVLPLPSPRPPHRHHLRLPRTQPRFLPAPRYPAAHLVAEPRPGNGRAWPSSTRAMHEEHAVPAPAASLARQDHQPPGRVGQDRCTVAPESGPRL